MAVLIMGFFIGDKYFAESERYSGEYYSELNRQQDQRAAAQRKAEKVRLKQQAARRAAKKQQREQWRLESELHQKQLEERYGKAGSGISGGTGGASSDYNQFGSDKKEGYCEDIARRYGTLYNSNSAAEAPKINRGMGVGHHQQIKRSKDVKHHSALGPLGAHKKIPVGMIMPGINSDNPNLTDQGDDSKQSSSQGGSTKLSRPF